MMPYYSVYRTVDDMPVIIHGTDRECAAAMRVTLASFRSMASRIRRGKAPRRSRKFEIIRDEENDNGDFESDD